MTENSPVYLSDDDDGGGYYDENGCYIITIDGDDDSDSDSDISIISYILNDPADGVAELDNSFELVNISDDVESADAEIQLVENQSLIDTAPPAATELSQRSLQHVQSIKDHNQPIHPESVDEDLPSDLSGITSLENYNIVLDDYLDSDSDDSMFFRIYDPTPTENRKSPNASCPTVVNQTGCGDDKNDWERYCYIQPLRVEVTRSGRITQVAATSLEFKGLGQDKENDLIRIPQLLDNFLKKTITDNGGSLEETHFCVQISHAQSAHTSPLFMNFRKYPQTNGLADFNMMGKINQSNANLDYKDMNITVILYDTRDNAVPAYQGGIGNFLYFDVHKKIRRRVRNNDKMCLARALVLGKCKADNNFARTPIEKDSTAKIIRRLIRTDNKHTWRKKAEELLRSAGIPTDLPIYGTQHLDAIAKTMPEYRIQLYARQLGQEFYTLAFPASWNPTGRRFITIAHHDNHFDFIQPGRETMNIFMCDRCGKGYKRFASHRCEFKCPACQKMDCKKPEDLTLKMIRCTKCNVVFKTQTCYDNHKIITGSQSTCDRFQLCVKCGKYLCNYNHRKEPHQCEKSTWCEFCVNWEEETHECCWTPPDDEDKAKSLKKQEKFKLIFFDIESVVVETLDEPVQYAPAQWANLIVCQMVCETCHTGAAGNCQCIPEFHFGYEDGDGKNSVVDRCVDFWLNDPRCKDAIMFSHNGSRFDNHFILAALIRRDIAPQLIQNGTQLIQMTVQPMKKQKINHLVFKDSYLLTPLPLAMLPEAFGIPYVAKGEFPFLFNHPDSYGKVLPGLPSERFYIPDSKKPKAREVFLSWYNENKNKPFNFDEELLSYCKMDVEILRKAMCKYMVTSTELSGWNPLVYCATYASYSMFQLKNNHAQPKQIAILPVNGYGANETQSVVGLKMLLYLESQGKTIKHKLNGGEHHIVIRGHDYRVDGFEESTKTVYEILGCLWHGCPKCHNPDAFAPGGQRRFSELLGVTMYRHSEIRKAGYTVVEYWEHDINSALTEEPEMRAFFNNCNVVGRLVPRDAFLGGRTQTYKLKAKAEGNRMIDYVDFNSLYPATTSYFAEYPLGSPKVITDNFEQFKTGQPSPYRGLIKCDILPPLDIQFPVVGCRLNGKLIFPICYSCAKRGKNTDCTHQTEEERMIHVTLCDVEMTHALLRGYKVKKVYEVWSFEKWQRGGLFKAFNDKYTRVKMEASGWPGHLNTAEEKKIWLDSVYQHTGIRLNPDNMMKNPGARTIAKLSLNSSWGKMGERCDKTNIEYVSTLTDRLGQKMVDPANKITGAALVEHFIIVASTPAKEYRRPVHFSNVVYAAITTATARLKLLEAMEKVGDDLIYTDTDSLMYYRSKDKEDPLASMRGEWIGMLACEVPDGHRIVEFVSPAAKVYSISMINEKGESYYINKVKGVTVDYEASQIVGFESLTRLVDSLINDDEPVGILTVRAMITRKLGVIGTRMHTKRLTAVMDKVLYYPDFTTKPYGYWLVRIMSAPHTAVSADRFPQEDKLPINAIMPNTIEWITYCIENRLSIHGKPQPLPLLHKLQMKNKATYDNQHQ